MITAGLIGALTGALIAALGTVLALNFVGAERRIERKLEHGYSIDDPQFLRELGSLLGPPIIGGNRVANLENGAAIFPGDAGGGAIARSTASTSRPTSTGQATSAAHSPRRWLSVRAPASRCMS